MSSQRGGNDNDIHSSIDTELFVRLYCWRHRLLAGREEAHVGAGHGHGHAHGGSTHRGRLVAVFGITTAILGAEVAGGLVTGSLTLWADAGHLATDAAGIGLSLLAMWMAGKPPTPQRTFGYQRAEILAAVANAALLFAVAAFVLVEAVRRLFEPPEIASGWMVAFGVVGLAGNVVSLLLLVRAQESSLNLRGAFLEVLNDALGSAAVIVAALVIAYTGWERADAVASLVLGLLILPRTWRLLREAVDVLLEATPKGVDLTEVRRHLSELPGVVEVHDLHAWTITSGLPVLSAHVVVEERVLADGGCGRTLDRLQECLGGHFDVEHCTFQLEPPRHREHEQRVPCP